MQRPTQQRLTMRNMPKESVRAAGAKRHLAGFLAISLLGALPGLADAAPPSAAAPSAPAPAPATFTVPPAFAPGAAAIAKLSHGAAKILAAFQAAPGIDGYGIEAGPNQDGIVYTTADGQYVFMGDLFGPDGSNLSQTYAQQYLPAAATAQPTTTPAAQLWPQLSKLTQIQFGSPKAAKHVVIFLDPNCIYCHLTYEAMLPYVKNGSLLLSVVPVGVVKATSIGRAEALLTAKDPVKALALDETKFDVANEEGGLAEAVNPPANIVAEINANNEFMQTNNIDGTPYLMFHDASGAAQAVSGMPQDIKSFLAGVN
jgi:thiol:disulfide interchange protein DsbG